ncbi:hypothetical protein E5A74_08825 [Sphingomonas naasensis]|uniref:Tetratricopeptide repeat protein n=2 Tax=Sphingomonas naasensis TaxID=1344951 RepID=A0A4S1WMZ3_9SPHN|nr:hypothetical protein [Sphingomonas naasensis]TGX43260.1 hypothetical protein E5A74_08825 [Sphingomonas naasensis]
MQQRAAALLAVPLALALLAPAGAQERPQPPAPRQSSADDVVVTGERDRARSKWLRAESANFTLYAVDEAQAREMAARLERFDQLLRLLTRTAAPAPAPPLAVYLLTGASQVERLRRQSLSAGQFATGYYSAAATGVVLAADMRWDMQRARTPRYSDVWLFTEYSRHFLLQNARGDYLPAWYVDGFTLNLATTRFLGDTIEYGRGHPSLALELDVERWEPIEKIVAGQIDRGQLYSAQSALLVHYILADPARRKAFERFLAETRSGTAPVAAFERAFGTSMKALHARLWRYRHEATYIRATATGFTVPDVIVSRLPRSADALLLDQAAMRIGIPEPDRQQAVLRRAEDAVAHWSDAFGRRVLAQAQILYGAPERADATLDALLESAPADPELLYLKGLRHLIAGRGQAAIAAAEFREARNWFARAWRADPDYYPALYGWVESLSTAPQFLSEKTLNALLKAALLAPQATQIQVTAATMMMAEGRFAAAEALLAPITVTPRDPASGQVPALLAQARAHLRADLAQLTASFRYTATWKDLNCC